MLPDWAPNVHPLVVHFPIALLFVGALVDAVALAVRKKHPWVQTSAVGLYALGALGAAVAFLTGRDASDSVHLPTQALTTLNAHADWALYLIWFASLYAALRVAVLHWRREVRLAVHLPLALLGLVGLVLVQQTATRGGRLVYEHGVAVAAASGGPDGTDTGSPDAPPDTSVVARLDVLSGAPAEGGTFTVSPGRPTLAILPDTLGDLEVGATLDLSGFTGTAALVHHVRGPRDYDVLALDKPASGPATLRQGRVEGGRETTFDSGSASLHGPATLKVYAVGTHFRGYLRGEQLTHGHGAAAPPGRVGLRLDGSGSVVVRRLHAVAVE